MPGTGPALVARRGSRRAGRASPPGRGRRGRYALARRGIPHRVLGSLGLYERTEVRDALAYLRLLVNPRDAQAFRRAIQSPRRGVGPATADVLVTRARESLGGDLIAASAGAAAIERVPSAAARDRVVQ